MPNPSAESLNSELRFRSPPRWEQVIRLANQTLPIFSLRIPTIWTLKQGLGRGTNHWKTSCSINIRVVRNIKQQPMSSNSQLVERSERKGPQAAFPLAAVRLVPESNFCCCIWTHHLKHQLIHQNHSTSTLLLHPSILQTFLRNVPQLRHESKKTKPLRNSTCSKHPKARGLGHEMCQETKKDHRPNLGRFVGTRAVLWLKDAPWAPWSCIWNLNKI